MPGAEARAALEVAVVRVGPAMKPQETANILWSFSTLRLTPGAEARAALEAAVVLVGPAMNAQEVANTVLAYATLGLTPGAEAMAALEAAVVRVGPAMTPHAVANTLWSFPAMAATRSLPLLACYPSLWRLAHGLDVGSFKDVELRMMFHAHLILTELVRGDVLDEVTFPPWIMLEAREAWMRQVRDDVTVSSDHKKIATIIGDLGVRHEVESLSDGRCFSVDVFLPDHDVAIEFDGPTHFINTSDGNEEGAPGDAASRTTRTVKTELRDMFLRIRYRTVVFVPWFEWAKLNDKGAAEKKEYVAAKLRVAGVSVPA
jgi:molybdopterin-binding protein